MAQPRSALEILYRRYAGSGSGSGKKRPGNWPHLGKTHHDPAVVKQLAGWRSDGRDAGAVSRHAGGDDNTIVGKTAVREVSIAAPHATDLLAPPS
ncbi:hypothetical protein VTH06DRAFT_5067 [Thermothelomyces fergusii]